MLLLHQVRCCRPHLVGKPWPRAVTQMLRGRRSSRASRLPPRPVFGSRPLESAAGNSKTPSREEPSITIVQRIEPVHGHERTDTQEVAKNE